MSDHRIRRRDLFKSAAAAGAGLALGATQRAQAQAADQVPKRVLGTTGEKIPILLMGGARRFDTPYDKMLHRGFREGVTYIDTAAGYAQGQSHKTLVPFLEQIKDRKKVWITSKVSIHPPNSSPQMFKDGLDQCLDELQTDYLDMFFMHECDHVEQLEPEYIKMADDVRKSGKTKLFGFSCHGENMVPLMNKAAKVGGIDAIMFRYNFRYYGDTELNKAMDACLDAGIGLIGMKTQGSIPDDHEKVVEFTSKNFTLAQAKMKAAWADERLSACVSGMKNLQEMMQNIEAAKSPTQLTANEFQQLNRLAALTAPMYCKGCSHICHSRIDADVNVGDTLRYLMYADSQGDIGKARAFYRALPAEQRAIDGVDFTEATRACPQHIDIAKRLDDARRLLA